MAYCHAEYGKEPSELHITEDGFLKGIWGKTCRGEYYEDEQYLVPQCLTMDLEKVYAARKQKEEEERKKQQEAEDKRKIEREKFEFERRREQFFKLKEEFEPKGK